MDIRHKMEYHCFETIPNDGTICEKFITYFYSCGISPLQNTNDQYLFALFIYYHIFILLY